MLQDVRRALRAGHREIVLTGINIGTYDGGWSERGFRGSHTRSALTLAGLVRRILDETPVERLRLSSIEPQHVDDELLRRLGRRRAADDAPLPPAAPVGRRRRAPADGPPLRLGRVRGGRRSRPIRGPGRRDPRRRHRRLPDRGRRSVAAVLRRSSARSASPASTSSATRRDRARRRSGWPARSTSRTRKRARGGAPRARGGRPGARGRASRVGARGDGPVRVERSTTAGGSATPRITRSSPSTRPTELVRERDRPGRRSTSVDPVSPIASSAAWSTSSRRPPEASMPADPDCLFCKIVAGDDPVDEGPRGRSSSSRSATSPRAPRPTSS